MEHITKFARTLRKNQTEAEKLLWSKLRDRQFENLKFRRQYPFPPYVLDFFCEEKMIAIECDGGQHTEEKDKDRNEFLKASGITIYRYWNNDILKNMEGVLEDLKNKLSSPHPVLADTRTSLSHRERESEQSEQGEGEIKRLCLAKIAAAHGVKGLVKLHVFAENIDLLNGMVFTSESGNDTLTLKLKNATAKHWLAEIKTITDRTEAEKLRGTLLYIDKDSLPEPEDGEFYIADLIGLMCVDKNGFDIGRVIAIENFGASDLLEIKPSSAESFYLPFSDDTILDILDNKIIVHVPDGLRD